MGDGDERELSCPPDLKLYLYVCPMSWMIPSIHIVLHSVQSRPRSLKTRHSPVAVRFSTRLRLLLAKLARFSSGSRQSHADRWEKRQVVYGPQIDTIRGACAFVTKITSPAQTRKPTHDREGSTVRLQKEKELQRVLFTRR